MNKIKDKLNKEKNISEKNINKKRHVLNAIRNIIIILIIIMVIILAIFLYFNSCIDNINKNYELQQYNKVSEYDSKLDIIEEYLKDSEEEYEKIKYKVKVSVAIEYINIEKYQQALEELDKIKEQDNLIKEYKNKCNYELGKKLITDQKYETALKYLSEVTDKEDIDTLLDKCHYELSLKYLEDKKYTDAVNEIDKVKNTEYENLNETKKEINYEYGKWCLEKKNYVNAINTFEKIKDYKDSTEYIHKANIEQAESFLKAENYSQAKELYNIVPNEFEHNGIKAYERKELLNRLDSIINAIGKKYATKSYCESRNVWKYDGRWDSWYVNEASSAEYIDLDMKLNDNGTVTLTGNVKFQAFNNFSSLAEYCKSQIFSRTIRIENINNIPASFDIDENTKLLYSNGKFSIKYSKKDNYSTSFYNLYTTSVTY